MDRAVFNRNLLNLFENEHIRLQQNVKGGLTASSGGGAVSEKIVLDWKFALIDVNRNGMLDKTEYRELKRLIKKVRFLKSGEEKCSNNRLFLTFYNGRLSNRNAVVGPLARAVMPTRTSDCRGWSGPTVSPKTI